MTTDTAALAANDDTVPTIGDHIAQAAAAVTEQPADSTAAHTDPPAERELVDINVVEDPPTEKEAALGREIAQLRLRLGLFEQRRDKEQQLLGQRDAALHAIEGAKARVQSEKQGLAEIEEEIAALLREPIAVPFEETPIGQAITESAKTVPPPMLPWQTLLPAVPEEQVRLIDGAGDELPTVDALCGALTTAEAMGGEARKVKAVEAYGTPWLVTHLWKHEATGSCRANVVRLYSKDEWQQLCEAKHGRAVADFDQSEEAKMQRQSGGEWCGLVVKVGRRAYVVGPQKDALHLAYMHAEAPAEQTAPAVDRPADEDDGNPD